MNKLSQPLLFGCWARSLSLSFVLQVPSRLVGPYIENTWAQRSQYKNTLHPFVDGFREESSVLHYNIHTPH